MGNVISLQEFGPVWDRDGDMVFEDNLKSTFDFIIEKGLLKNKKQKYSFHISTRNMFLEMFQAVNNLYPNVD